MSLFSPPHHLLLFSSRLPEAAAVAGLFHRAPCFAVLALLSPLAIRVAYYVVFWRRRHRQSGGGAPQWSVLGVEVASAPSSLLPPRPRIILDLSPEIIP